MYADTALNHVSAKKQNAEGKERANDLRGMIHNWNVIMILKVQSRIYIFLSLKTEKWKILQKLELKQ